jgi:hypothetical protein
VARFLVLSHSSVRRKRREQNAQNPRKRGLVR